MVQEGFSEEVIFEHLKLGRQSTEGKGGGNSKGGPVCLECSRGINNGFRHLNGNVGVLGRSWWEI